jgi:serine/threonine protein kinase
METAKRERHRLALPLGYRLGRYEFREQLGFGSFGITYLAYDRTRSRKVAIKELLPTMIATRCDTIRVEPHSDDEQWRWALERFVAEAETLAACKHPNVLRVFEVFRANGTAYMVTQFQEGCTLTQWLKKLGRKPTDSELRGILELLLSALDTVHAHQFLHRDIKPDNIYMTERNQPVLIDFGSARQDVAQRSAALTAIVTEGYAPFEQYSENGRQGPWTDLYALAGVMYCAIVGRKPPSATERAAARERDPCICLTTAYRSQYSAGLLQSIDAGLRFNARSRLQSTAEWRRILAGTPPSRPERMPAAPQQPGTRGHWSYAPKQGSTPFPAAHPSPPNAGSQKIHSPGQGFRVSVAIFLLLLGTAVIVLLVQLKDKDNGAAERNDRAQQAERDKRSAESELQRQKDENEALRRKMNTTPIVYNPRPPSPTAYPPAAPARNQVPEGFMDFFRSAHSHNLSNNGAIWAADFAPYSYYCYGSGSSSREFIANDRQKLINRYPTRSYSEPYDENIEVLSPEKVRISYNFNYRYSGGSVKPTTSSTHVTLVTDKSSGRWQIISFQEAVKK